MLPLHSLLPLFLVAIAPPRLSACSAGAKPNRPDAAAEEAGKLVFILAGQSNMAGRGGVVGGDRWDHVVPPECRPSPAILRLSAGLRWEEAQEPLHADIDVHKTCGVGPGMPFAHDILSSAAAPAAVALVPCAVGGTKITQWERGTLLYGDMVRRARAALDGGGGRLGAVLWYQGESDTVSRADAEAYKGRMEQLIRDLRSDLGLPKLLVIQVALASGEGSFIDIVRAAQKGITLPDVACVDAKGLALQGDHLHLTTSAQIRLGRMLAASYLNHSKSSHHSYKLCHLIWN